MMKEVFIFFSWDIAKQNIKVSRILCLCSSMEIWLSGFNSIKKSKDEKKNDTKKERMKAYEMLKPDPNLWP
jgi:hypothetical protein